MFNKAFTLIEMIIVAAIFSIIGVGVAASFVSGMEIWGRARNVGFRQSNALIALEMIAQELRQSVNISYVNFTGTETAMTFPVVRGSSVMGVTYEFSPAQEALIRRQILLPDIIKALEEAEEHSAGFNYTEKKFLAADSVAFNYFYFDEDEQAYNWTDTWEDGEGMFSGVRMDIKDGEYNFTKTVFLPIAPLITPEAGSAEAEQPDEPS